MKAVRFLSLSLLFALWIISMKHSTDTLDKAYDQVQQQQEALSNDRH